MSDDIEQLLRAYLRDDGTRHREVLAGLNKTDTKLDALTTRIAEHETKDEVRHVEVVAHVDAIKAEMRGELKAHSGRIDKLEQFDDVTGVRTIEELKERYATERDARRRDRELARKAVIAIASTILLGVLGWGATRIVQTYDRARPAVQVPR